MTDSEIIVLLKKYESGQMDSSEMKLFVGWCMNCQLNEFINFIEQASPGKSELFSKALTRERRKQIELGLDEVERNEGQTVFSPAVPVAHRVTSHRLWWAAAAVFLIMGTGGYIFLQDGHNRADVKSLSVTADIKPGRRGAMLTLSDGSTVVLDSLANGVVATQGSTEIKLKDGKLLYDQPMAHYADGNDGKDKTPVTAYNTMTTPKGRQFTVMLPDGTQVWLNSGSSITYPTLFSGKMRNVKISGEVYFEVVKNKSMPFHVKVNDMDVEVLGTDFNINSYDDESFVNTTLLAGSVKISKGTGQRILAPGQLAQVSKKDSNITLVTNTDTEKIMAWKNGLFNFDGVPVDAAMRQLARWYDIEVVFEKGVPDIEFVGEMSRNVSLSGLLNSLQGVGVHFRIEGRRLVVLP